MIAVFLTAATDSVRVFFFQVDISLYLIKMSSLLFSLLTKNPIKSPFCLEKPHTYSLNSAEIEISGSQQSQTQKLKYYKSTRNFIEEIEN